MVDFIYAVLFLAVLGVLATASFVLRVYGRPVAEYYAARTTVEERETVAKFAQTAVVYVRNRYGDYPGDQQFELAFNWLVEALNKRGITVKDEELKAMVELAYEEAKALGFVPSLQAKQNT
ncbi:MAG: phage holin, LLH family [Heliobacteriaceae bacterium]|nr:phage holin, LLH family [Heliobacteriaceae bacterium]MDD4587054.1 phage holin, LLH family [Heliobacteriaceae bacterium]